MNLFGYISLNFDKADNKEWLDELVSDLEEKREKNVSLPCRITDIKDKYCSE